MGFLPAPSDSSGPKQSTPPQPKTDSDVNTKIPDKILGRNIIICPHCNGTGIYIPDPALVEFKQTVSDPLPKEEHPCSQCGGSGRMLKIVLLRRYSGR